MNNSDSGIKNLDKCNELIVKFQKERNDLNSFAFRYDLDLSEAVSALDSRIERLNFISMFSRYKIGYENDKYVVTLDKTNSGRLYGEICRSFIVNSKSYIVTPKGCYLLTHEDTGMKLTGDLYLAAPDIELKSIQTTRETSRSNIVGEREYYDVPHTDYYSDDEIPNMKLKIESVCSLCCGDVNLNLGKSYNWSKKNIIIVNGYLYLEDRDRWYLHKFIPNTQ
jgi:hypothetical protein